MAGGGRRGGRSRRGRGRPPSYYLSPGLHPITEEDLEEDEAPYTREDMDAEQAAKRRAEEDEKNKLRKMVGERPIARERGIVLPEGSEAKYFKVWKVVENLGWEEFIKEPVKPCLDLVMEFYINLPKASEYTCKVFGIPVVYSEYAIRSLYRLPRVTEEEDGLKNLKKLYCDFSERELEQTLTFGNPPQFTKDKEITMTLSSLVDEAQFWRRFIKGRVLGITNQSDVSKDIQKLLFVLLTRQKFDVAAIIEDTLSHHKRCLISGNVKRMSLSFPSLITALCFRAGVQVPAGSVTIRNEPPCGESYFSYDPRSIISVYSWHKHFYGARGTSGYESPRLEKSTHPPPPAEEVSWDDDELTATGEASTSQVPVLALPGPEGDHQSHGQRLVNLEAQVDVIFDELRWMRERRRVHRQDFEMDKRYWDNFFQGDPQGGGN